MFSKMSSLFSKTEKNEMPSMEEKFDHSKVDAGDAGQCPFMKKNNK